MSIKFHVAIHKSVHENSFRVTDEDLGKLVKTKFASDSVGSSLDDDYFRVLLRRTKDHWVNTMDCEQAEAVEHVHKDCLGIVVDNVITPEIAANPEDSSEEKARKTKERGRRTNFARSAGSVLRRYVKLGGDLPVLDPMAHGKAAVVAMCEQMEAKQADESENTPEAKIAKRLAALITAINQLESPQDRTQAVAHCTDTIQRSCP